MSFLFIGLQELHEKRIKAEASYKATWQFILHLHLVNTSEW